MAVLNYAYLRKANDRYRLLGRSPDKILFVVLVPGPGANNEVSVVTARTATRAEKRLLQARGKGSR
jgi:uncharacterized DUF497 family protein